MNIFVLDLEPKLAAHYHHDTHVNSQLREVAQMLSTAHRLSKEPSEVAHLVYKPTHAKHPCTKWVRESVENYNWAFELFTYLCEEFKARTCKDHKTSELIKLLEQPPVDIADDVGLTAFALAMPEQFRQADAVQAYRHYYAFSKLKFSSWTSPSRVPDWLRELIKDEPIRVADREVSNLLFLKQQRLLTTEDLTI